MTHDNPFKKGMLSDGILGRRGIPAAPLHCCTMTAPAPQTIASELLTKAYDMLKHDAMPTQSEMHQLEAEATKLASVDAVSAFEARAAIAALSWDVERVHQEVRNLLHLDASPGALINSALTLSFVNDLDGAAECSGRAWLQAPNDESVLRDCLSFLAGSGRMHEARRLAASMPHLSGATLKHAQTNERIVAMLDREGITETRVHDELSAAMAVMAARRIRVVSPEVGTQSDPESGANSLLAIFTFHGDYDDEAALAEDLAKVLMESPQWNPSQFAIVFDPQPRSEHVLHAA
ncbi:hypothetical protein QTI66_30305 [Variovorax sp. J22R133]|uniref:hypothetical protein n=1 Tax=Variovorax brevis TaxID=3053503 RepID=UPI002574F7B9|nr:hypothetical protein [Variovorax sp. J22R133]MDM0116442.1 hypothetical protein [Variovorax sp. J22R133]